VENAGSGFAGWLGEQLGVRGWTQKEFAARAGIDPQRVSGWLAGRNPSSKYVPTIARTLGFSAETVYRAIAGHAMTEAGFQSPRSIADAVTEVSALLPVVVPLIRSSEARMRAGAPVVDYLYLPMSYRTDPPKRYFALLAPDDAMLPDIRTWDALVIDPDARPKVNDITVIATNDGISVARLTEIGARRLYRQDATGETVTAKRASDLLGVVIVTIRSYRR
jgi:phage repressor protein C with HTH and peptisase S24 domain